MEVVNAYLAFFAIVFVILALVVVYKLLQIRNHTTTMAKFYKHNYQTDKDINVIRKRLMRDPKLLEEIEKEYEKEQKAIHSYQESQKKELITKRVFAYEYEDLLYQIYGPSAKDVIGFYGSTVELEKGFIIHRIAEIKQISVDMAENVFDILLAHDLLYPYGPGYYKLTPMLASNNADWNIVSDTDMNLDKWMATHGYEHKKN